MSELNAEDAIKEAENILKDAHNGEAKDLAKEMFGEILENKRKGITIDPNNEKALTLRDHCIEIARSLNSLLPMPILQGRIEDRPEAITKLGKEMEALRAMDTKPEIHGGDDPESFTGNPLKAAEYWASQLFYGIRDYYVDFVFHPNEDWNHPSNRRMQAYIELTDVYLSEQLGTTNEGVK